MVGSYIHTQTRCSSVQFCALCNLQRAKKTMHNVERYCGQYFVNAMHNSLWIYCWIDGQTFHVQTSSYIFIHTSVHPHFTLKKFHFQKQINSVVVHDQRNYLHSFHQWEIVPKSLEMSNYYKVFVDGMKFRALTNLK